MNVDVTYECVTLIAETAEDYSLKLTMKKEYREDPLFTYYEGGLQHPNLYSVMHSYRQFSQS